MPEPAQNEASGERGVPRPISSATDLKSRIAGIIDDGRMPPSRDLDELLNDARKNGISASMSSRLEGGNRPLTAVHWSHSQWPFAVQKAAVRITLLKPPVLTHSGSRRFVLTNLKCKSEIRIVVRDLLTFEGREVRSGEALSFPRNIG